MRGDFRLYARTMPRTITDLLSAALREALGGAGLPVPPAVFWEPPRDPRHGDYATNVAMTLAREARQAPRRVADAIVAHFPRTAAVDRLEIAGPGFLNVFLSPAWCAESLREILGARDRHGMTEAGKGRRYLLEFVSANPTGPLVIVNARAAAVGDALASCDRRATRSSRSTTSTTPATSLPLSPARWTSGCARRSAKR
jgi:arginyl-tRNA synthetase